MTLDAVRCAECGGAVHLAAGRPHPRCLFCGHDQLVPFELPEGVEPPAGWLVFEVDEAAARSAFRAWASSSFWYPDDLRHARLRLEALLVPAWSWSGRLETCWAGLVPAATRAGRRPETGVEERRFEGVLIPSSQALTRAELDSISPFHGGELKPLESAELPWETGSLTRSAARQGAIDGMEALHAEALRAAHAGVTDLRLSVVAHELRGGPLLLPVWIGAYRRGDALFRVVVNGQTGRLTGKAPISWVKVGLAALGVLAFFVALVVCAGAGAFLAER